MASRNDDNLTLCVPRPSSGQNPHEPVIVRTPKPDLSGDDAPANHILIKIDRFGFSANNVTYQALGEAPHFRYFEFHASPTTETPPVSPKTHGVIPVWGFGTIIASTHPDIKVGERVYGYLAPSRYLLLPVSTSNVTAYACHVPRPHLPADRWPYNQITRCGGDPMYNPSPAIEDLTMLYRPLFWTSFWCEDWLFTKSSPPYCGAKNILISSASSKTAFSLAYNIKQRLQKESGTHVQLVALTSKGNTAFTTGLGLYDAVYDYDSLTSVLLAENQKGSWLYIDVAGNDALNTRVFTHLDKRLAAAIALGVTNLSPSAPEASAFKGASAPTSSVLELEQFFLPEWLTLRRQQLPMSTMITLQVTAWAGLMRDCAAWVKIGRVSGGEEVVEAYKQFGKAGGPDVGWVWSLWEESATK